MYELKFRSLKADEIELRPKVVKPNGFSVLLYKNARTDMNLLDEVVGSAYWKREHYSLDGTLVCKVSVYNNYIKEWVSKEDVGTESNVEKEKGEASDSFKRACVCWGIGRELYTSPFVWIKLEKDEVANKVKVHVSEIEVTDGKINKLVVCDSMNKIRFKYGSSNQTPVKKESTRETQLVNGIHLTSLYELADKVDITKDELHELLKCQYKLDDLAKLTVGQWDLFYGKLKSEDSVKKMKAHLNKNG